MNPALAKCPFCDGEYSVRSGNLKRHIKTVHKIPYESKEQMKEFEQMRCESFKQTKASEEKRGRKKTKDAQPQKTKRSRTIEYLYGEVDPIVSSVISTAVHDLLEQHDIYNLPQLTEYVVHNHEDVPGSLRQEIIIAATSAAWYVAKMYFTREKYLHSSKMNHHDSAEAVAGSMLHWFTGLRPMHLSKQVGSVDVNAWLNSADTEVRFGGSIEQSSHVAGTLHPAISVASNVLHSAVDRAAPVSSSLTDMMRVPTFSVASNSLCSAVDSVVPVSSSLTDMMTVPVFSVDSTALCPAVDCAVPVSSSLTDMMTVPVFSVDSIALCSAVDSAVPVSSSLNDMMIVPAFSVASSVSCSAMDSAVSAFVSNPLTDILVISASSAADFSTIVSHSVVDSAVSGVVLSPLAELLTMSSLSVTDTSHDESGSAVSGATIESNPVVDMPVVSAASVSDESDFQVTLAVMPATGECHIGEVYSVPSYDPLFPSMRPISSFDISDSSLLIENLSQFTLPVSMETSAKDLEANSQVREWSEIRQEKFIEQKSREVERNDKKKTHGSRDQEKNENKMKSKNPEGKRSIEVKDKSSKKFKCTSEESKTIRDSKAVKSVIRLRDISNEINVKGPIIIERCFDSGSCQIEPISNAELSLVSSPVEIEHPIVLEASVTESTPDPVKFIMDWAHLEINKNRPIISPIAAGSDEHPEIDSILNYEDVIENTCEPISSDINERYETTPSLQAEAIDYSIRKDNVRLQPVPLMSAVILRPPLRSANRPMLCPSQGSQRWTVPRGRGRGRGFPTAMSYGYPPRFRW
jgi:hypothetical protein